MEKEVLDQMLQRIKEGSDSDFIDLTLGYDAVIKSLTKSYFEKCKHLGAEYEDLQQEADGQQGAAGTKYIGLEVYQERFDNITGNYDIHTQVGQGLFSAGIQNAHAFENDSG
jgi:hypothetical protein